MSAFFGPGAAIGAAAYSKAKDAAWRSAHPNQAKYDDLVGEMTAEAVKQAKQFPGSGVKNQVQTAIPVKASEFAALKFDNLAKMGLDNVAASSFVQNDIQIGLEKQGYVVTSFRPGSDGSMLITLYKKPSMWGGGLSALFK